MTIQDHFNVIMASSDQVALSEANDKLLAGCPGHNFEKQPSSTMAKCSVCGGVVSFLAAKWYEKGLMDGAEKESKVV